MGANIGQRSNSRRRKIAAEINIVPFVDVMLVLLLLFMAVTPMLVGGVEVDLPDASTKPIHVEAEPLTVTIDKAGNIYIMETQIPKGGFVEKLKAITHQKMDSKIIVKGDKALNYGEIMSVIGDVQKAGFTKVALVANAK